MFYVQRRLCATCIYRPESTLDLQKLEDDVRDPYVGFRGYRVCHHSDTACCRGFWNRHKDEFSLGQIAQRLGFVCYVDHDTEPEATDRYRNRQRSLTLTPPRDPIMNELTLLALKYVLNTGETATVEHFDDDHDPIGPLLRVELVPEFMHERDGVLKVTDKGHAVLRAHLLDKGNKALR